MAYNCLAFKKRKSAALERVEETLQGKNRNSSKKDLNHNIFSNINLKFEMKTMQILFMIHIGVT